MAVAYNRAPRNALRYHFATTKLKFPLDKFPPIVLLRFSLGQNALAFDENAFHRYLACQRGASSGRDIET